MTVSHPDSRPAPPPYASLRTTAEAAAVTTAQAQTTGAATPAGTEVQYWRQEADKLDALLQTLWSGFLDAPSNGLPTALADYVATYTGAMRLKLTLMGYTALPNRSLRASGPIVTKLKQP